ncbi:MAG: hypothetical protein HY766_07960 [candidate division NC10 bacterium]|nr:hypothetical protein [candidate division NC10 bacterium]MBI4841149.1 hypothetical protein [candidate division NC10 bacterium]
MAPGRIGLGALLFLLLVAIGIYLAVKFVPPYWTYLSLQDPVKEAAMAAVGRGGEDKARADLLRQAREAGLDLADEDIQFTREGPHLVVRINWVAPVELPRVRYDLHFRIEQRALLP